MMPVPATPRAGHGRRSSAPGLVDKRIAAGALTGDRASRAVMAKSVDGMTAEMLYSTVPGTGPGTADGIEVDTDAVQYKGIDGVLFCAGADCKVEDVTDGHLCRHLQADRKLVLRTRPQTAWRRTLANTGDAAGTYT